eukprot:CAMPEP_0185576284 /NCGR_PEP_ID=MMETSP0434-20130131/7245_1 /TAXON_ID=626734 ORGANISM="Favella taraikaensis, Strain Fe Narragansett Bay" /NCGR_SAMPLE_ID=MMETSP0434 /ASSEMBLY_ACC=CAM_ASM_000379 /LENGTH=109 /DNA_ID=CAMNT_0028193421 /DNA_START=1204 /DNA_END=1530 /DNA_ORIENTATION=-
MHVLVTQHQVCGQRGRVQVVSEDLDHDAALFDAFLRVGHFFSLAQLLIAPQEHEALAVAAWRDKHHVNHVLVLEGLMVRDLTEVLVVGLTSALVVRLQLNEVVNKVRRW